MIPIKSVYLKVIICFLWEYQRLKKNFKLILNSSFKIEQNAASNNERKS